MTRACGRKAEAAWARLVPAAPCPCLVCPPYNSTHPWAAAVAPAKDALHPRCHSPASLPPHSAPAGHLRQQRTGRCFRDRYRLRRPVRGVLAQQEVPQRGRLRQQRRLREQRLQPRHRHVCGAWRVPRRPVWKAPPGCGDTLAACMVHARHAHFTHWCRPTLLGKQTAEFPRQANAHNHACTRANARTHVLACRLFPAEAPWAGCGTAWLMAATCRAVGAALRHLHRVRSLVAPQASAPNACHTLHCPPRHLPPCPL